MAGQLDAYVTGDKDVELSFGQLNLDVGKTQQYARVDASVNSGQIDALAFAVSKGGTVQFFLRSSGQGRYRVHAHVGSGAASLGSRVGRFWLAEDDLQHQQVAPTTMAPSARLNTGHSDLVHVKQ